MRQIIDTMTMHIAEVRLQLFQLKLKESVWPVALHSCSLPGGGLKAWRIPSRPRRKGGSLHLSVFFLQCRDCHHVCVIQAGVTASDIFKARTESCYSSNRRTKMCYRYEITETGAYTIHVPISQSTFCHQEHPKMPGNVAMHCRKVYFGIKSNT